MARLSSCFQVLILIVVSWPQECSSILDCSSFTLTNTTSTSTNLATLLNACFAANPYDTSQPPLSSSYLSIAYDYSVMYVITYEQGVISLLGQLSLTWPDVHRQWNVSQLPIAQIHLPLSEIWYPQILFLSTIKKRSLKLLAPDDVAILVPTHTVVIVRNVIDGHCDDNYFRFPFDTQVCSLDFAINRYFIGELDVVLSALSYTYQMESFVNEEWTLMNVASAPMNISFTETLMNPNGTASATVAQVVDDVMTGFEVNITLCRHSSFYIVNLLIPLFVLTVVGQTSFAIPEDADSKILVPLTVLLGFMFVQGIVASYIPHSTSSPIVADYVVACVVLSGASCLSCAVCKWLALLDVRLPAAVKTVCVDGVGFLLFPSRWLHTWGRPAAAKPKRRSSAVELNRLSFVTGIDLTDGNLNMGNVSQSREADRDEEAERASSSNSAENERPWLPVAQVLNRLFALGHMLAIIICFFTLIFPLVIQ